MCSSNAWSSLCKYVRKWIRIGHFQTSNPIEFQGRILSWCVIPPTELPVVVSWSLSAVYGSRAFESDEIDLCISPEEWLLGLNRRFVHMHTEIHPLLYSDVRTNTQDAILGIVRITPFPRKKGSTVLSRATRKPVNHEQILFSMSRQPFRTTAKTRLVHLIPRALTPHSLI